MHAHVLEANDETRRRRVLVGAGAGVARAESLPCRRN